MSRDVTRATSANSNESSLPLGRDRCSSTRTFQRMQALRRTRVLRTLRTWGQLGLCWGATGVVCRVVIAFIAVACVENQAMAQSSQDGVYGRFEGDVALAGGVGARVGERNVAPALWLHSTFLATAGVYGTFEPGVEKGDRWALSTGVEMRPLFLPRFANSKQIGSGWTDLVIDSVGLSVGPRWFAREPVSLDFGLSVEVPFFSSFSGPLLQLKVVHSVMPVAPVNAQRSEGVARENTFVYLVLAWRSVLGLHLVDYRDGAQR